MSNQLTKIKELVERRVNARLGGGQKRIDAQHAKGKLTARERLELLLDEGSFEEFVADDAAGVVTGKGAVLGRPVYAYAHDASVSGGALSENMALRTCEVMDMAISDGLPLVALNDSVGAKIQDGVASLEGYGDIFKRNIKASGVIPQISGIFGSCAGGAVYSPALTDFTVMVRDVSHMFVTGPSVVKAVTGESVTRGDLGGASMHACKSGVSHYVAASDVEAISWIRNLLSFLPSNNRQPSPVVPCPDPEVRSAGSLCGIVPDNPAKAYDMMLVVRSIADAGDFFIFSIGDFSFAFFGCLNKYLFFDSSSIYFECSFILSTAVSTILDIFLLNIINEE